MAQAIEWVSRITTVALEMVLPGILGQWLDTKLGTRFLGLIGFAVGVPFGIWHLLRMTRDGPRGTSASARRRVVEDAGEQTRPSRDEAD
jgi:hypothetical protein